MVVTVHHLNNSRSQRVLWLLEELEVPYTIEHYEREASKRAPASLKKVHPLGKSPVITDGDITLIESGAIVDYLIRKYGNGRAVSVGDEWINDSLWSHFAEGEGIRGRGRLSDALTDTLRLPCRLADAHIGQQAHLRHHSDAGALSHPPHRLCYLCRRDKQAD